MKVLHPLRNVLPTSSSLQGAHAPDPMYDLVPTVRYALANTTPKGFAKVCTVYDGTLLPLREVFLQCPRIFGLVYVTCPTGDGVCVTTIRTGFHVELRLLMGLVQFFSTSLTPAGRKLGRIPHQSYLWNSFGIEFQNQKRAFRVVLAA